MLSRRLVELDHTLTARLEARPAWLQSFMRRIVTLGGPYVTLPLGFGAAIVFYSRGEVVIGHVFLLVCLLMVMSELLLKRIWRRTRPDTDYVRNMRFHSYSFPSGHVLNSVLLYGLITYFLYAGMGVWGRVATISAVILFLLTIGHARIYLGAHYVLDVLVGSLLGSALLVGIIVLVDL